MARPVHVQCATGARHGRGYRVLGLRTRRLAHRCHGHSARTRCRPDPACVCAPRQSTARSWRGADLTSAGPDRAAFARGYLGRRRVGHSLLPARRLRARSKAASPGTAEVVLGHSGATGRNLRRARTRMRYDFGAVQQGTFVNLFKTAVQRWLERDAFEHAAALAFCTLFSLAPLMIIVVAIVGTVFGEDAASGRISAAISDLIGSQAASAVEEAVQRSRLEEAG